MRSQIDMCVDNFSLLTIHIEMFNFWNLNRLLPRHHFINHIFGAFPVGTVHCKCCFRNETSSLIVNVIFWIIRVSWFNTCLHFWAILKSPYFLFNSCNTSIYLILPLLKYGLRRSSFLCQCVGHFMLAWSIKLLNRCHFL